MERKGQEVLEFVGKRLREARKFLGMTQAEAAQRLGIRREYLSLLEAGKRPVPMRLLSRMAELYGRPESWFYGMCELPGSLQAFLDRLRESQAGAGQD